MVVIQATQIITVFTLQIQNYLLYVCMQFKIQYKSIEKKLKVNLPVLWVSDFDFPLFFLSNWNEKKSLHSWKMMWYYCPFKTNTF